MMNKAKELWSKIAEFAKEKVEKTKKSYEMISILIKEYGWGIYFGLMIVLVILQIVIYFVEDSKLVVKT